MCHTRKAIKFLFYISVWAPIASVGWYILGFAVIACYAFPRVQKKYKNWQFVKNQQNNAADYKSKYFYLSKSHNNSFIIVITYFFCLVIYLETEQLSQTSAEIRLARQKLQDEYNKSSDLARIKEEEV